MTFNHKPKQNGLAYLKVRCQNKVFEKAFCLFLILRFFNL